jgi:hypothetical protein
MVTKYSRGSLLAVQVCLLSMTAWEFPASALGATSAEKARLANPQVCHYLPNPMLEGSSFFSKNVFSDLSTFKLNPKKNGELLNSSNLPQGTANVSRLDTLATQFMQMRYSETRSSGLAKHELQELLAKHHCRTSIADDFSTSEITGGSMMSVTDKAFFIAAIGAPEKSVINNQALSIFDPKAGKALAKCKSWDASKSAIEEASRSVEKSTGRWRHASYSDSCSELLDAAEAICSGQVTDEEVAMALATRLESDPLGLGIGTAEFALGIALVGAAAHIYQNYIAERTERQANENRRSDIENKNSELGRQKIDVDTQIKNTQDDYHNVTRTIANDPNKDDNTKLSEIVRATEDYTKKQSGNLDKQNSLDDQIKANREEIERLKRKSRIRPANPEHYDEATKDVWSKAKQDIARGLKTCTKSGFTEKEFVVNANEVGSDCDTEALTEELQDKVEKTDPLGQRGLWEPTEIAFKRIRQQEANMHSAPQCIEIEPGSGERYIDYSSESCKRDQDDWAKSQGYDGGMEERCIVLPNDGLCNTIAFHNHVREKVSAFNSQFDLSERNENRINASLFLKSRAADKNPWLPTEQDGKDLFSVDNKCSSGP